MQDSFAWGSGSLGLLFLFIILLIVVLTWKRCPSCVSHRETQLVQTSQTAPTVEVAPPADEPEAAASGGQVVPVGKRNMFGAKYMKYTPSL